MRFDGAGPGADNLVAIDGFEITGYAQAIYGDFAVPQRLDLTNNFIHDNRCNDPSLAGAGFALNNVSGNIRGNVIRSNICGRGGAGFINDAANKNTMVIESNLIDGNAGIEPTSALGGALYLFVNRVAIRDNLFSGNTVTQQGAGLYLGAFTAGGQQTSASLARNVYRANRAGAGGGGLFCDDGASCTSEAETYEGNCGGNILLGSGGPGSGPTVARFANLTNASALEPGCTQPGTGVTIEKSNDAPDAYTFTNSVFRGNADGRDFATTCTVGCDKAKVSVSKSTVHQDFANGGIQIVFEGVSGAPPPSSAPTTPAPPAAKVATAPAAVARVEPAPPPPAPEIAPAAAASPLPPPPAAAPAVLPPAALVPAKTTGQREPAVTRGATYMGFPERFNRHYTDQSWKPSKTLFVSPDGSGNGASRERPMPPEAAVKSAKPGTMIFFLRGAYEGCFELGKENSGTYDEPVVFFGERNDNGSAGVSMRCCTSGRQSCFNLEAADYVAVDGIEMTGGKHGVRTVGSGFESSQHARGVAVIGCSAQDQAEDAFMSGHLDWAVWERNLAHSAKKGGHGFYITNGSDWNIIRLNEAHSNGAPDLEVSPDPKSGCGEDGIKLTDPRCDAFAGEGEGGRGASDYFLIDSNFFHSGTGAGPTFSGLRRSIVRNNIFAPPARHNVTFWQDTKNPKLASSDNKIIHNLFATTGGHAVKFEKGSTRNEFANNVLVGVSADGGKLLANPKALLMEVDASASGNTYRANLYSAGQISGRTLGEAETQRDDYAPGWFEVFSVGPDSSCREFRADYRLPLPGCWSAPARRSHRPQRKTAIGSSRPGADRKAMRCHHDDSSISFLALHEKAWRSWMRTLEGVKKRAGRCNAMHKIIATMVLSASVFAVCVGHANAHYLVLAGSHGPPTGGLLVPAKLKCGLDEDGNFSCKRGKRSKDQHQDQHNNQQQDRHHKPNKNSNTELESHDRDQSNKPSKGQCFTVETTRVGSIECGSQFPARSCGAVVDGMVTCCCIE